MTDHHYAFGAQSRTAEPHRASKLPACCSSPTGGSSRVAPVRANQRDLASSLANERISDALVKEYGRMRAWVRREAQNAADTDDVLQDLCLKALAGARTLRDGEKTLPWIRSILRNLVADRYRREAVRKRAENGFLDLVAEAVDSGPDRFSVCGCLDAAIPKLRPRYAEILRRVDMAKEPRPEVAASLGISVNNLRVQVLRARRALRRHVEDACTDCPAYNGEGCTCLTAEPAIADRGRHTEIAGSEV